MVWGFRGGIMKFSWFDDVEDERDFWGDVLIFLILVFIMCIGDVIGEGDKEVEVECWIFCIWFLWFMWLGFTVGKGRLFGKGIIVGGMFIFIIGIWEWIFEWKLVGLMIIGFWFIGLLGIGLRMLSGFFLDVNGFFWRV